MNKFFLAIISTLALQPLFAAQKATVMETVQTLKTYPFSDPNPIADPNRQCYPYSRFDGFYANAVDKQWKTVVMENDFIKVTLFPEIGGKIWGAVDKTTGKEFIYNNHVVKFRDIALRGPWTSGGIEFNFGIIGHVPTSSTPVDYLIREKEDGSVSYYVTSYELVTRTVWNVEVNLPKDKAYFTTTTTWYNQSGVDQPYYQWMNAAYKAEGNAQFCYPGNSFIGHEGDVSPWPVDVKGRNISWYKNNDFGSSKSCHICGFFNDYFGIYWHDNKFGSVHHAGYDEKLGMKFFVWGLSREGAIWEDLLTDTDGQYIEMQSGRMYNQPSSVCAFTPYKHHSFAPLATDRWTEYWYPVKEIGGISKSSRIGALHVVRDGSRLDLAFSPVEELLTTVRFYDGEKEIRSVPLKTKVLETWKSSFADLGSVPKGNLRIIIGDRDLVYTERKDDYVLSRPQKLPTGFDWNSAYGLYIQGEQWMNQKVNGKAEKFLKQALEKDAYFGPALNRLASLYYREGRCKQALGLLKTSLSLNAYDGEANYLYGLCNQRAGRAVDAKDGFSVATYSPAFRSAAYAKLAEMYLGEKDWKKTEHYALLSLRSNVMNLDARQTLMVLYRKTSQREKAEKQIAAVLKELPLCHFARFEQARLAKDSEKSLEQFKSLVRNELPFETYIELAGWYESAGCKEDALALLNCAGNYPIAVYKRAYLLHQLGREEESAETLRQAAALSPEMVFPFRAETLESLNWAATVSKDWKIDYYRGLICWANKRNSEALALWEGCGDKPSYIPFYLSRAQLRKQLPSGAKATPVDDMLKAEKLGSPWRVGFALINAYTDSAQWKKVVEVGERYMKKYPQNYYIGLKLARGYNEIGQYSACIDLLDKLQVLPNEGAYAGRSVYRAAHLYRAMDELKDGNYEKAGKDIVASQKWPENLGVGKPYDELIDDRLEAYLQSRILKGTSDKDGALVALKHLVSYQYPTRYFTSGNLLTALAFVEFGQKEKADRFVESWKKDFPDDQIAAWCTAVYKNEIVKANQLLKNKKDKEETTPWEAFNSDTDHDLMIKLVKNGLVR